MHFTVATLGRHGIRQPVEGVAPLGRFGDNSHPSSDTSH